MTADKLVSVVLNLPVDVNLSVYQDGWGSVNVEGSLVSGSTMTLTATAASGFTFKSWEVNYEEFFENPLNYSVTGLVDPIDVLAVFERNGEFMFTPNRIEIPYNKDSASVKVTSSKKWALDSIAADWVSVSQNSGDAGVTEIEVKIIK